MFNVLTWHPCLEEKGNYVSVNHHYGPGGSVFCLGFLIRCDTGSETGDCR